MLLMSDGLAELFNDNDEMLDYPRIREAFKEVAEKSPDQIVQHLYSIGDNWRKSRNQGDDITLVVLKAK